MSLSHLYRDGEGHLDDDDDDDDDDDGREGVPANVSREMTRVRQEANHTHPVDRP